MTQIMLIYTEKHLVNPVQHCVSYLVDSWWLKSSKHQTPNTKHQTPNAKRQTPNTKHQTLNT